MFYREKGFYLSILAGVVAIVAFSAVCLNMTKKDNNEELPNSIVAEQTKEPTVTAEPEYEEVEEAAIIKPKETAKPTKEPKTKEASKTTNAKAELHFNQETGLLWPVEGKVLMEYSPDKVVYFKTLAQYRVNPAILIQSQVGTKVLCSASGVVESIKNNDETGKTVSVSIGDGFSVVYGQLNDVSVKKGQSVQEGEVIGKIAEPSKYYSSEGANLYYQVKQKKTTVNPLVLLR